MSKRNAHAVAARQREAGPHREDYVFQCEECGKDMGYDPKFPTCVQCDFGAGQQCPDCDGDGGWYDSPTDWIKCWCQ